ncbi:unnamed protein product (mitochondrion) [Musa textilis]
MYPSFIAFRFDNIIQFANITITTPEPRKETPSYTSLLYSTCSPPRYNGYRDLNMCSFQPTQQDTTSKFIRIRGNNVSVLKSSQHQTILQATCGQLSSQVLGKEREQLKLD